MKLPKERIECFNRSIKLGQMFSTDSVIDLFGHIEVLEQENTELNQTNLMYLGDIKGLQRQLSSAKEYGIQVNKLGKQARNELIEREHELKTLKKFLKEEQSDIQSLHQQVMEQEQEKIGLTATLERAMLDHQPVVLPKEVAEAIKFYQSYRFDNADIYQMGCEGTDGSHALVINNWLKWNGSKSSFMSALVNGYTVEEDELKTTEPEIREEIYTMIDEWYKTPFKDAANHGIGVISEKIAEFMKGIKN